MLDTFARLQMYVPCIALSISSPCLQLYSRPVAAVVDQETADSPSTDSVLDDGSNSSAAEYNSSDDEEEPVVYLIPGFNLPRDIPTWSLRNDGPLPIWPTIIPLKQNSGSKKKAVYVVFRSKQPGIYYDW